MLWILGGLFLAGGLCLGVGVWYLPVDQFTDQMRQRLSPEQLNQLGNVDLARVFQITFAVIGVISLIVGGTLLICAGFIRRGSRPASVIAIVICSLIALWSVLSVLGDLVAGARGSGAALIEAGFWIAVGGSVGMTILWLLQALRMPPPAGPRSAVLGGYPPPPLPFPPGTGGYGYGVPPDWSPPPPQQALGPIPPAPPPEDPFKTPKHSDSDESLWD